MFCKEGREQFDKIESLPSLFKKECLSKERRERFALGHKKGETCQKPAKNTNFSSDSLFFARDLLESHANYSHRSFLKGRHEQFALLNEGF